MRIETKDTEGRVNGVVFPLWNELTQPGLRPAQVYATTILPGMRKGPHLHMGRRGVFYCVQGKVHVRKFAEGTYHDRIIEPGDNPVFVGRGCPSAMYNVGHQTAIIVNMPNPAWSKETPDDHPVTEWEDPEDWQPAKDYTMRPTETPIVRFKRETA